ncbi:phage tail protein [Stenotrophomonas nematodicola]|uniref:Phage tail length tape measure family protein n=1 Tax=Stenotrophomonas nematodicola TaxID=2656746 RepID=A0ABW7D1M3_9GAMM
MALYTLTVDLLAETGSFERDLGKAARASDRSARAMRQMQREMSDSFAQAARDAKVSVTSIDLSMATLAKGFGTLGGGALLGMFIAETVDAQNELAQLNAALKSTGQAAGFNSKQLTDMADKMAKATIQSSGEIVNAQTRLLSYTSIVGDNFPRALQLAIDQSVRLGENITQSAETIGKALEYPTEGISALTKQGFRFTEQQKDMLASLVETGRLAEAQAMVMGVMEESYAGAGKAARETLGGALIGLKESFNDLLGSQAQSGGIAAATAAINSFAQNLDVVAAAAVPLGVGLGVFYAGGKLARGITALNGLWATNAMAANRAAVGMMGMVPATVRLTAAQTAARVAAQGLSSAYAALGGPVGIAAAIATAAAGWWMVRDSTTSADSALVDFNGTLDDTIEKFRELNKQQQAGEILRLQREMQSGYEGLTAAINQMVAVASTEIGGPRFKAYVKDVGDLRLQFQAGKVNADQFAASLASANTRLLEGAPAAARVNDKFVEQTASAATLGLKYEQQNRLLGTFIGASSGAEKQTDATTAALNRQVVASKAASDGINQHLKSLQSSIDSQLVNLVRIKQGAEAAFMVDVGQKINAAGGPDKLSAEQRAEYNNQIAQGLSLIRQTELAQKAAQASKAGDKTAAKEQKATADSLERYRQQAELAAAAMSGPLSEAMAKHLQNMAEYNTAVGKGNIAQADANVLMAQSAIEYAKVAAEIDKAMAGPELLVATMDGELAMLGKVGRARELYRRQLQNERDMRQELQKAVEAAGSKEALAVTKGASSYEEYERAMLAAGDAAAAMSLQVEEAAANVEAWANVVMQGVDGAADAMADFVASGLRDFDSLWDDMKDVAKQGLRDIARELLQQKLVIPIQTKIMEGISSWGSQGGGFSMDSLMGLFGGNGSAGGGQNIGNIAGLLSKGQGLFSAGAGAASSGASAGTLMGFGNNLAAFTGSGATAAGGSAAAGAGAAGSSAAAAVPIIGWIIAGMMKNAELFDQGWDIANGESWAGKIATAGAVGLADKSFRGLGFNDKTASILSGSSIHAKLFGRSAPKITGQGLTGSYGFGGFDGQSYADIKAKGGMFRSDKKWTQYGALDPGIDRTFDMAARQVRGATTGLAKQLGVDLSSQLAGVKVTLGKLQLSADSAEAKAQLEAYLGDMTDKLFTEAVKAAGFGGQLDEYFEASDVFGALSASIALAVGNADELGRALNSMEIEKVNKAVDYFQELASVAGTDLATQIEKVSGLLGNYASLMADVTTQLLTGNLTGYQSQALSIERTYRQQVKAANDYAKALGLSGARAEDLAKIEALRATNMGKLQAQIEADKKAIRYGLDTSELSPLTDQEKLKEAMQELERAVGSGDSSAAQAAAQAALGFGRNLYASGKDYNGLYGQVTGLIDSMKVGNLDLEDGTSMGALADAIEALPDNFSRAVFDLVVDQNGQGQTTAAVQQSNALLAEQNQVLRDLLTVTTQGVRTSSSSAIRETLNR